MCSYVSHSAHTNKWQQRHRHTRIHSRNMHKFRIYIQKRHCVCDCMDVRVGEGRIELEWNVTSPLPPHTHTHTQADGEGMRIYCGPTPVCPPEGNRKHPISSFPHTISRSGAVPCGAARPPLPYDPFMHTLATPSTASVHALTSRMYSVIQWNCSMDVCNTDTRPPTSIAHTAAASIHLLAA